LVTALSVRENVPVSKMPYALPPESVLLVLPLTTLDATVVLPVSKTP